MLNSEAEASWCRGVDLARIIDYDCFLTDLVFAIAQTGSDDIDLCFEALFPESSILVLLKLDNLRFLDRVFGYRALLKSVIFSRLAASKSWPVFSRVVSIKALIGFALPRLHVHLSAITCSYSLAITSFYSFTFVLRLRTVSQVLIRLLA